MKTTTATEPHSAAWMPLWIESAPRLAPTVRSSSILMLTSSAPERSTLARSVASALVNPPSIWPRSKIRERITGADITRSSSTTANCSLTCSPVILPKRCAPFMLNSKLTTEPLSCSGS
jgi:hypothetical protein